MDRHRERTEHDELLFAIVASSIANYAGKMLKEGHEVAPRDFMPSQAGKPKQARIDKPEEVAAGFRSLFGALMEKQQQAERIKKNLAAQKEFRP